jgi:hypothetical protein
MYKPEMSEAIVIIVSVEYLKILKYWCPSPEN